MEEQRRRLEMYLMAEAAILGGAQSYTIGDRQLTRADLGEIRRTIDSLLLELKTRTGNVRRAVFVE